MHSKGSLGRGIGWRPWFFSDSSCTRFGVFLGWVNRYLAGGGAYGKTDGTDGFSVENWPFRSPFLRNIVHLFSGAWAHNREVGFFRWRRNPGFCTGCDGAAADFAGGKKKINK